MRLARLVEINPVAGTLKVDGEDFPWHVGERMDIPLAHRELPVVNADIQAEEIRIATAPRITADRPTWASTSVTPPEEIRYGGEQPPTDEERVTAELDRLRGYESEAYLSGASIDAAVGELDRLGVPRETHDGNRLSLAARIRYMACGSIHSDAPPRLLQAWAPEVWSGGRKFEPMSGMPPNEKASA